MEPIDDSVVDQGRELLGSVSEGVSNRGEAESHMEVLSDTIDEELPGVVLVVEKASAFDGIADRGDDSIDVFSWEEIRDFSRGEQIVDEHKEALVGDLTLSEEEHETFILDTSLHVHLLEINLEVGETVGRRDDNGHGLECADG